MWLSRKIVGNVCEINCLLVCQNKVKKKNEKNLPVVVIVVVTYLQSSPYLYPFSSCILHSVLVLVNRISAVLNCICMYVSTYGEDEM